MKIRTIRTPERFLEVSPIEVPGENDGKWETSQREEIPRAKETPKPSNC